MSKALSNPVAAAIARAASRKPTGEVERWRKRVETAGRATVLVLDVSGSMAELARGDKLRIDLLREAVAELAGLADYVIAFSTDARIVASDQIPNPGGNTCLDRALDLAATLKPGRTIVVSDGVPSTPDGELDHDRALQAAERLPGRIDVVYCGPEWETDAIEFMRRLARVGGGTVEFCDWNRRQLAPLVRGLLGPAGGKP